MQGMNPSMAAYEVGYDSPSQFSREYTRHFGTSPRRDVDGILRQAASWPRVGWPFALWRSLSAIPLPQHLPAIAMNMRRLCCVATPIHEIWHD